MKEKQKENIEVRKSTNGFLHEFSLTAVILALAVSLSMLFEHFAPIKAFGQLEITYSEGMVLTVDKSALLNALVPAFVTPLFTLLLLSFFHPSGLKPNIGAKGKNILPLSILSLFGILAYVVLTIVLSGFGLAPLFTSLITSALVNVYIFLLYKLYFEERTYSNFLFWEIFRFAIVGLVAAVFDFLMCYLIQFVAFSGGTAWYVTLVSTACGFLVGVLINYLMSTYMVYKNAKTNTSKTVKGMVLFFVLSLIGLLLGMGIQYLLYDYLFLKVDVRFLSYPVDFVIRTLIVMVFNYVTRKLFVYR